VKQGLLEKWNKQFKEIYLNSEKAPKRTNLKGVWIKLVSKYTVNEAYYYFISFAHSLSSSHSLAAFGIYVMYINFIMNMS
jgi:hypothetical protein